MENKKLYIISGIPGSGKTTKAEELLQKYPDARHFEADMYFMVDGEYKFDPKQLTSAHNWCQQSAFDAMDEGRTVIVSNTFVLKKHMEPYITRAEELGYNVEVLVMRGRYKSIHNVPDSVVERMRLQFEER